MQVAQLVVGEVGRAREGTDSGVGGEWRDIDDGGGGGRMARVVVVVGRRRGWRGVCVQAACAVGVSTGGVDGEGAGCVQVAQGVQ